MPNVRKQAGVTLPEMMVAISITLLMLAAAGMVFQSTTKASGKSMAVIDVMNQMRAVTSRLDRDFRGLRRDLPMVIISEQYNEMTNPGWGDQEPDMRGRPVHYDRIAFFANGNFRDSSDNPGMLARIFYGQSGDLPDTAPGSTAPARRILARRQKIMSATAAIGPMFPGGAITAQAYDALAWEATRDGTGAAYYNEYFWTFQGPANYLNGYFPTVTTAPYSFARRPTLYDAFGDLLLQPQYLLADVTDLRIEVWNPGDSGWMTLHEVEAIAGLRPAAGTPIAVYWNVPDIDGNGASTPLPDDTAALPAAGIDWFANSDFPAPNRLFWPKALRFTMTIYDKNRVHYERGYPFSYIIQLPQD